MTTPASNNEKLIEVFREVAADFRNNGDPNTARKFDFAAGRITRLDAENEALKLKVAHLCKDKKPAKTPLK